MRKFMLPTRDSFCCNRSFFAIVVDDAQLGFSPFGLLVLLRVLLVQEHSRADVDSNSDKR